MIPWEDSYEQKGFRVTKNEYGYFSADPLPTEEELQHFYEHEYYQQAEPERNGYVKEYSEAELEFIDLKLEQKRLLLEQHLLPELEEKSFLDVGCGEGFALSYFVKFGWQVAGLDFSSFGMEQQNPAMLPNLMQGDFCENLQYLIQQNRHFDVVNLDNVLEHVREPQRILSYCRELLSDGGVLLIKVPNDFNPLQHFLLHEGCIKKMKWLGLPDHLSYFNKDGLVALAQASRLEVIDVLSDGCIEFFALNPENNYYDFPEKGHNCHLGRMAMEKLLYEISPAQTLELYRHLGSMNLGREIICLFKKAERRSC